MLGGRKEAAETFQCKRSRATLMFLGSIGVIVFGTETFSPRYRHPLAAFLLSIGLLAFCAFFVVRGFVAASVAISGHTLKYRSKYRTYTLRRDQILDISSGIRFGWTRLWSQPFVDLKKGRRIWFADWSVPPPPQSKAVTVHNVLTNAEYEKQQQMVLRVRRWLDEGTDEGQTPEIERAH
jgi:hypothetical protein